MDTLGGIMIKIKINLFGAFRKYGNGQEIQLQFSEPLSVHDLKKKLANKLLELHPDFNNLALIEDSVFADDASVLSKEFQLMKSCEISVLPPVCGG